MIKKYRVVLMGLREPEADFKHKMSRLGVPPTTVEQIVHMAPVVIKKNMTLGDARQYADAVQNAGGRVNIQEIGLFEEPERDFRSFDIKSLGDFTMCPECGHKQPKAEACAKCGFALRP